MLNLQMIIAEPLLVVLQTGCYVDSGHSAQNNKVFLLLILLLLLLLGMIAAAES
jgi:hypothetical protein